MEINDDPDDHRLVPTLIVTALLSGAIGLLIGLWINFGPK